MNNFFFLFESASKHSSGNMGQNIDLYEPGNFRVVLSGPDPEEAIAGGGGRPSMVAERGPRDPGAVPRWGSRGIAHGSS